MDLIVFSHLRWNFVYQRPQHIIGRMAKIYRTFYIEEPQEIEKNQYHEYLERPRQHGKTEGSDRYQYHHYLSREGVNVIVPMLKRADVHDVDILENVIRKVFEDFRINEDIFWYYTPMALEYTSFFSPKYTVYDCMNHFAAIKLAQDNMIELEEELFNQADIVFAGGKKLYEAKKQRHDFIYCFPNSVDKKHFERAKGELPDPYDQSFIRRPRAGFYGVLDERFDVSLLKEISDLLPFWNFIIVGPVVKIDPAALPKEGNIYYLGKKKYEELPYYLSNWDAAIMPFAINEITEYISPAKTNEYLAAGKRVISTAIHDVVDMYEDPGLVNIGRNGKEFADYINLSLNTNEEWYKKVQEHIKDFSWDTTFEQMHALIIEQLTKKNIEH